jgi:hypothetical protein
MNPTPGTTVTATDPCNTWQHKSIITHQHRSSNTKELETPKLPVYQHAELLSPAQHKKCLAYEGRHMLGASLSLGPGLNQQKRVGGKGVYVGY